ncbi:acyl-CoA thioesterase [Brachybacterium sp. EF45031]|uniref:acyl-CoA thioesterase n=1 Tax=Brachybacterium sillae TaxID=2810536 RepID=UPI00217D1224|nr:thioesterase family protein [Brachybacterium sillae]MCS6712504.1 acyl-CoA thioesterase [Brachybacterium sillae]
MAHLDLHVDVRWSDLDAYGHVNNAATLSLLEEARIAAFWTPPEDQQGEGVDVPPTALAGFGTTDSPVITLVASQRLEYLRPIEHRRDGVVVRLWLSRLGGASFDVDYLILQRDDAEAAAPYVKARTTVVIVDRETQRPVRLGDEARAAVAEYEGEPLSFRG